MTGGCCGQGARPQQGVTRTRTMRGSHDEEVCHGTGERRRDLIEQLKIYLGEFDDKPCMTQPPRAAGANALRPLGQHPEYLRKHHQSWMPAHPSPPLITSVGAHEIRPTDDYEKKSKENDEYVTYVDARSKPPPPSCDCAKRNGLQDRCTRYECSPPTPQCLATNPGPCCPPSMGLTGREAAQQRGPTTPLEARRESTNQDYGAHYQGGKGREARRETTNQDYGAHYQGMPPHRQGQGHGQEAREVMHVPPDPRFLEPHTHRPRGHSEEMICFCKADRSAMPPGKKYLCCPVPPM